MPPSLLSQIAETYTLAGGLSTCSAAPCHLVFCFLMLYCVPSDLTVALPRQDGSYPSTFVVPYARLKVILDKHSHPAFLVCCHTLPLVCNTPSCEPHKVHIDRGYLVVTYLALGAYTNLVSAYT